MMMIIISSHYYLLLLLLLLLLSSSSLFFVFLFHVKMETCVVYCAVSLKMEKEKWHCASVFGTLGKVFSYCSGKFCFFGGLG